VVAYSATTDDRLPPVVAGVGAGGLALTALALAGRWPSLLPWGIVGVGASYTVFLSLQGSTVDAWSPAVAAAVFAAAELSYWSVERGRSWSEQEVLERRFLFIGVAALFTALVGAFLLVAVSGVSGGVAYEALGVGAAVLTLTIVAVLSARTRPR
jgi:hypothetical protein